MKSTQNYIVLTLVHALLGFVIFSFKPFSKFYFGIALVYFIGSIIVAHNDKKTLVVLKACAYFVGAEVLFRMTRGGIAYESSKYLVILFMLMGMFFKGVSGRGYPYFMYLILLIPSIFVASLDLRFDANFRTDLAFVLSGPVCLGLASLFLFDRKVSYKEVFEMLFFMTLPIVTTTFYLLFFNPSIKDTIANTSSNFAASGGFGPNQVSTVLGLGIFGFTVRLLLKSPTLGLKIFNSIFLILIAYRAVITFSRGGVFAAIITITAFLVILYSKALPKLKTKLLGSLGLLLISFVLAWVISSSSTMGLIDKRYANEDALGREKQDLSTGRLDLILNELDGFIENPFVGIGASITKYRREGRSIVTHNEVSRLLSEHGIIGIVILLILIFTPLSYRSKNKKNIFFYAFLAFWFATINHSAMRLAAPAFFYSLSLINIKNEKPPIHRKRAIQQ
ncbi:O-antigen ligase-like membrane protein [Winogradskyella eximia]|uniref:O-antigen ligase-like membrane protein n=1 Tax=Winogradskyella eximia TaxID=262006 RepID=A0A3D9GPS9_9FLAO|nr:O-antigen ligase family protein [Winogradskyella eximia]RED38223.1 O-antigen ligase-like membrane protein [Winogradskyella eximia]